MAESLRLKKTAKWKRIRDSKVNGTADDPAALIRIYRYDSESDAYVERKPVLNVVHRFSTLEKFDAEVRKSSVVKEQREFRMESAQQNGNTIRGYAAVYNSDSEWMGGFYEQIATGAFDGVYGQRTFVPILTTTKIYCWDVCRVAR